MASVKFTTGNISSLPQELSAGTIYFAITDDVNKKGKIIFDKDESNRYEMTPETSLSRVGFATCETGSFYPDKEIILQNQWNLERGNILYILFSNTNFSTEPLFSIIDLNGKEIKSQIPVYYNNGQIILNNLDRAGVQSNLISYLYDGERFNFAGWSNATSISNGVKPYVLHTVEAFGPQYIEDNKQVQVNNITSVEGRYYALEMDSAGRGFVNVPWESGTSQLSTLKIGPYTYNGSEDVTIETYSGTMYC